MSVYLFFGEETYLLETKVKKLKKDFGEIVQGINYIQIDDTNVQELISDLETPAFGFSKKMIIAKNAGLFKKEKKSAKAKKEEVDDSSKKTKTKKNSADEKIPLQDKIANYLQNNVDEINETVDLIFIEEEVEKNALYELIQKIGEVREFAPLKLPELTTNLKKIASAYKVNIDDSTAKYLVECCGTNMQDLINELRKLIEYEGENRKYFETRCRNAMH